MTAEQTDKPSTQFRLDWLVSNLRWLWLLLLGLFVVGTAFIAGPPYDNATPLLGLIGIGAALNAAYVGLLWAKFFPEWLAAVSMLLDALLALALLVMTGASQLMLPLVLFPVIVAGVRWNTEAGLIMAVPIIIGYAIPLAEILRGEIDRSALITALLTLVANALALILAGTLPGFFLRQRVELAQTENEAELEKLRIENEQGKLISDMAITLSSTLNYHKVLRATVDTAFRAIAEVGNKDDSTIGMVLLFEGDGDKLTVAAGRNISRNDQGRKVGSEEGVIGRAVHTAEVTITNRANKDKSITAFASTPGYRSAICAPLRAGFQTFGVLLFCSTEANIYGEEHKKLLSTFCSQAIIPLQNAQLFEDVHREQQRILEKESEARRKLARDLHDGPTQSVAAIVMRLNFIKMVLENGDVDKALDEVIKVEEIAQRTTHEIRTMLFAMRPVILETQGLIPALNQYAQRLNQNEDFQTTILNRGYNGQLDGEAEGVIFAIIEEAVGNAKKHAQATEIRISLVARQDSLFVEVRDNGIGFDVESTQSTYDQRTSLGLINMNERAEIVGGNCELESARGKGTAVKIEIPYHRAVS
ncbi:MAG: histidine kinase [Anaerolineae bacterium]